MVLWVAEPEEFEDFDGDEDAVDLRAFSVMGGVFHFNLLQMPPQPKNVQSWTITQGQASFVFAFSLAQKGNYLYRNTKPTEELFAFHLQFLILTLG